MYYFYRYVYLNVKGLVYAVNNLTTFANTRRITMAHTMTFYWDASTYFFSFIVLEKLMLMATTLKQKDY